MNLGCAGVQGKECVPQQRWNRCALPTLAPDSLKTGSNGSDVNSSTVGPLTFTALGGEESSRRPPAIVQCSIGHGMKGACRDKVGTGPQYVPRSDPQVVVGHGDVNTGEILVGVIREVIRRGLVALCCEGRP